MKWSVQSSYEVTYPENIFLQAFAELGAPGLLGAFAMVFTVLKRYDPKKKDLYLGFSGLLCMNLVGVDFNYVSSSMLAALFAGLIINNGDNAPRSAENSATAAAIFRVAGVLFTAALIAGCAVSVKKIISDTYLNKAIDFSREAKWNDAVNDYKKALDEDKYNITAGYFLAQAYYDSDPSANAAAALGELEETGKLAPDYVLIHYRKAVILSGLGRADEAADEYRKMIKIDPYFREALAALAYISYNRGDWDSALSYTNKALEKYPSDAALYSYLGNIYFASKRPDKAVLAYKKAVEISGNKDYYYNLSCIYYTLKDFAEAKANIDEALKRGGESDPKVEKMASMIEKQEQIAGKK
jgi:tetratricopeptide (TPR) repeat protein